MFNVPTPYYNMALGRDFEIWVDFSKFFPKLHPAKLHPGLGG